MCRKKENLWRQNDAVIILFTKCRRIVPHFKYIKINTTIRDLKSLVDI